MIQMRTVMSAADNSGAKLLRCISVRGSTGKKSASIGEVIKVSVKVAHPNTKVKKGEVYNAIIVRTASPIRRIDGSVIRFSGNAAVLVNDKNEPIGTRIFGPLPRELRAKNFTRILSLAPEVL